MAWKFQGPSLTTLLIASSTWHNSQTATRTHTHTHMQWFDSSVFVNECQWQHDWRRPLRPWFKLVTDWMSWRTDITISIAHLILQTHTNVNDEGDEDSVNDQNVHKASQWQCELRLKPLAVLHVLTLWRIRRNMKKPSHSTPIQTFMLWCRPITCVAVAHDLPGPKKTQPVSHAWFKLSVSHVGPGSSWCAAAPDFPGNTLNAHNSKKNKMNWEVTKTM